MRKTRNPVARALRSPHLAPKVVQSKKIYSRKGRSKDRPSDYLAPPFATDFYLNVH